MTNRERFKQELSLLKTDTDWCEFRQEHIAKGDVNQCKRLDCTICKTLIQRWLDMNSSEKLTEAEKIILTNIDHSYKWIARDSDGTLTLFKSEPKKDKFFGYWKSENQECDFNAYNHLFSFVVWDNQNATKISDLL